jgi:hypothetical protein
MTGLQVISRCIKITEIMLLVAERNILQHGWQDVKKEISEKEAREVHSLF